LNEESFVFRGWKNNIWICTCKFFLPDTCPYCNRGVEVESRSGFLSEKKLQLVFKCPINLCKHVFVGIYEKVFIKNQLDSFEYSLIGTEPKEIYKEAFFNEYIESVSSEFIKIFNEAKAAEQMDLNLISGMGYRKALEYLIKDYLIKKNPSIKDELASKNIMMCINQDINDPRIKSAAKRAIWLGNDETHYVRKHTEMNLRDLKALIDLTQQWISMEMTLDKYEKSLPDK
jgi:hypothetical protein